MICLRQSSLLVLGTALLASTLPLNAAAQSSSNAVSIRVDLWNPQIAFSADGHLLRIIGSSQDPSGTEHVRAITCNVATGAVLHTIDLQPDTRVSSTTTDGRTAIIVKGLSGSEHHVEISIVDTETGKTAPIPIAWYDPKETNPDADLSGDGRLISIYSEGGKDDHSMTVSVYTWPARRFVAKQALEFFAGGISSGGITTDGHAIEFSNNRSGSILVDLKTGQELARLGPGSIRSSNGNWVVKVPDASFEDDSTPRGVFIKDASGKTRGSIDVPVPDEVADGQMSGAFCGDTNRFILYSGDAIAAYAIPSGALLTSFPVDTWRDPAAPGNSPAHVYCSPAAGRVAILSGTRLTLHPFR